MPRHGAEAPTIRPVPGHDTAGTRPRYDHPLAAMSVPRCASAHLGVPAGLVLVLVHLAWFLTWFFDSVVFLSHRLDPVHEHYS